MDEKSVKLLSKIYIVLRVAYHPFAKIFTSLMSSNKKNNKKIKVFLHWVIQKIVSGKKKELK